MSHSPGRAQFLRGEFSSRQAPIRPPWAIDEMLFVESCRRSGACIAACPEKILSKSRGGFPQIDFAKGACTFCAKCLKACSSGALQENETPWRLTAHIEETCLTHAQVVCRTCGDYCPTGAIRFPPLVGGVARPQIDAARCTGCGACFAPCPRHAVQLVQENEN